jgi:[ribosomal protein S18]-alanine N-acetyltransferase
MKPLSLTTSTGMAALHAACFWNGWSEDDACRMMATHGTHALGVHDAHGALIGMLVWRVALDEADILTLAVHPSHQRCGYARQVLLAAQAQWRRTGLVRVVLEVAAHNRTAVALYTASGWQETGMRRSYYAQPDGTRADARIFEYHPQPR